MKLTAILMLVACLQVCAAGFGQAVTLSEKSASLEKIFSEIRRQTGYEFLYNSQTLAQARKVSIQVSNAGIEEVLHICFAEQPFGYILKGTTIVITPKPAGRNEPQEKLPAPPTELRGKVTDADGKPLAGASVKVVQLDRVVVTDNEGNYSIPLPAGSYTLEVSFISYVKTTREKVVVKSASATTINFTLQEGGKQLEEVVVTALGIERNRRALGYATTTIRGETLTETRSNNWLDALSGKVPGLNLIRSNGGPAGSIKVVLRGENNLDMAENEALIVVDGVVINHGSARRTATSAVDGGETALDYGTSLNDINPDDIENVTVLKGPGAAALYGGRGGNGAIVITTKWGKSKAKGLGISVNSNLAIEEINRMPSIQYEYGQGDDGANMYSFNTSDDGANTSNTTKAFGPKFNGQVFYQYDPATHTQGKERTPWVAYDNGFNDFFVTGKTYTNTVTVDGGTERTSARFSYTNVNNTWIVPNTGYKRNTVAMSVNSKPAKNLQITSKINYTNKTSDNLPATGYGQQSIMYGFIFWQPNAPVSWLRDYWMPGQENLTQSRPLASGADNPYAIAYEYLNKQNRNSVTGNIAATYTIAKGLVLTARTSMDMAYDNRSQQRPMDAQSFRKGMYRTQSIFSQEMNSDFLLKYTKDVADFSLSASLGGSMLRNNYNKDEVRADSLIYPGIFTMANSAGILVSVPSKSKYAINSLYGLVTVGYKDFAFLDFTVRNDWSSMLATPVSKENVSILYPSVNASLILSDWLTLPEKISYAKIRGSVAGVGSGGNTPYKTSVTYSANGTYPGGGLYNPTTLANVNLKPLYTVSYEAGVEAKFFRNRIGFDLTLYRGNTRDQILTSIVDPASGMNNVIVNAGMVQNKGIELSLDGTPVNRKGGLRWDVTLQFSSNKNTVIKLIDGWDELALLTGPGRNGFIMARVGGSMGDLYGRGYLRAPDGQIVYNAGFPVLTDSLINLGNTMPKWKASISNQFRYKNFRMSFLIDGQYGSVGYSYTQGKMAVQGKSTATLPGRYNGIIGDGVVKTPDGKYIPNTVIVESLADYYDAHFGISNVEGATFSTDFIKLRECRIDYTFKAKTLRRAGMQNASIGVYGRDLFILSRWPGFDPEFGTLSGADINRGFEVGQFPSTRSYGVNLTLAF